MRHFLARKDHEESEIISYEMNPAGALREHTPAIRHNASQKDLRVSTFFIPVFDCEAWVGSIYRPKPNQPEFLFVKGVSGSWRLSGLDFIAKTLLRRNISRLVQPGWPYIPYPDDIRIRS